MSRIDGEIVIAAPVEEVFELVSDERNEPKYNRRISYAEKTSPGPVAVGTRFLTKPRGAPSRGVMLVEVTEYEPSRRVGTSIRSPYLQVDGGVSLEPVDGGTRLHWTWDLHLRGPMRVMAPLVNAVGPRWERRNWVGLKTYLEDHHSG